MEREKIIIYKKKTDQTNSDFEIEDVAVIYEEYSDIAYDVLNKLINQADEQPNVQIKIGDYFGPIRSELKELVNKYPNDSDLGREIRKLANSKK
jgi:hypothetical protein